MAKTVYFINPAHAGMTKTVYFIDPAHAGKVKHDYNRNANDLNRIAATAVF
jgi:hypothetical protein